MTAARSSRQPAKVLLALFLGALLTEVALQVLAALGADLRDTPGVASGRGASGADPLTVVCLGDSNTYGVQMDVEDTYPSRLADLLSEYVPDREQRVVNLGLPGAGTRQVDELLDDALARYQPDLVLVLAGVNDLWRVDDPAGGPGVFEQLRTVRLLRLLAFRLRRPVPPATDAEGRLEFVGESLDVDALELFPDGLDQRLERHLGPLIARCRAAETRVALLTYGADRWSYGEVNAALRAIAPGLGVPLIDAAQALRALAGEHEREAIFLPDDHPREIGYEVFARAVYDGLLANDLLEGRARVEAPLASAWPPSATIELEPATDGAGPRLRLGGEEPGRRFRVLLSGPQGEFAHFGTRTLAVREDPILAEGLRRAELAGEFDGAGCATVPLDLLESTRGTPLAETSLTLVVCVLDRGERGVVRRISPTVTFRPADL